MSSALEYYAKQPQFLPAKACSWVSRDQRLWENSGEHVPHPFSLGEGEQQAGSLQPAPGDFPPKLLPFSALLQSDTAAAYSSLAALYWPRPHHHQERRGKETCPSWWNPWASAHTSRVWASTTTSPSVTAQLALTLLPAFMSWLLLTARWALLTQKVEGIRYSTERADFRKVV